MIDIAQAEATTSRFGRRKRQRERNRRLIREGRPLAADSPERVERFLVRRGFGRDDVAAVVRRPRRGAPIEERQKRLSLERVLGTNGLMGVAFLERGLQVARSVGRVWVGVPSGRSSAYGTAFLVSPRLLMTNHHVLRDPSVARESLVEFDYQLGQDGAAVPTTTFALDPDEFFFADENLDYAVVAVGHAAKEGRPLSGFGWNSLIEEEGKTVVSQWLNFIQHPNGEAKQLGLRENQLLDVLDDFLHYETGTAPGSSGSPVYNDRWEVVGLHHSGVLATNASGQPLAVDGRVWREEMGEHRIKWVANEGVRISSIIADLRRRVTAPPHLRLFEEMFAAPPAASPAPPRPVAFELPDDVVARHAGLEAPGVAGDEDRVLEAAVRALAGRADVLDVDLGYVFREGWITDARALVVTVRRKRSLAELGEEGVPPLPESFMGLPVEVVNPSVEDLVREERGQAAVQEAFSDVATLREEIIYKPPEGAPLDEIEAQMRVVAHVSPDAGWPRLAGFLGGTRERLTVGMYDFGAPHVFGSIRDVGERASFEGMTLVMQKGESVGSGTKADDLRDSEVVEKLEAALGDRFENAWVKIGSVNGWVSSSYHIKVAVRDREAFWLSSGNWQSSNLPEAEPLKEEPQDRTWLERYNREWHAIVEHAGLARVLETHLLHDHANNAGGGEAQGFERFDLPDLLVPEALVAPSPPERTGAFRYFEPFEAERVFAVRPLLTPDNYHGHVLELIEGAREELLIQNQTFNAPKPDHARLRELVEAVLARQRAGVEVRVILRLIDFGLTDLRKNLEALKECGFDMGGFRVQRNCHTKGIVVDRKRVLLGSQNWSNDGVSVNRDASLLFDDEELAGYFAEIFEHDWANLAVQDLGPEPPPMEPAEGTTPPGAVRLSWKDYLETR
ncbi:Serine protease, subtilase family [uncultured Rubrobacteraceae bacterium]|uniref:phospholipase D n=1 Tax=uncultured Rubrobacteraceae bacterium TaxID=349277 RepID=A0A6J4QL95_9ACTN|nr:Serine protease, subtilase family [uncultured Rubrobacteraceae bacterium]